MIRALPILAALGASPALAADIDTVPSGLEMRLYEIRLEEGAQRFRFVAPEMTDYETVAEDFLHLCEAYALPALVANEVEPGSMTISIEDRETEFGIASPEALQFFEAFTAENGACLWEEF